MTMYKPTPTVLNAAPLSVGNEAEPKLDLAMERIKAIVLDGLAHGFFEVRIHGEIGKNQRRELLIQAGKSHKFTIPVEDLTRG